MAPPFAPALAPSRDLTPQLTPLTLPASPGYWTGHVSENFSIFVFFWLVSLFFHGLTDGSLLQNFSAILQQFPPSWFEFWFDGCFKIFS